MVHFSEHSVLGKLLPKKKTRDTDKRGKPLGFKMHATSDMEHYRANSFWEKEPETLVWIDGFLPNSIFIDVGANIGVYSLYAAITKPTLSIYAIEPLRENYTRLVDNISLNQLTNITPINAGMAENAGFVKFYPENIGVGTSGGQIHAPINENGENYRAQCEREVLALSLDGFINMLPTKTPIYLKIDVDGHEMDIIRGITRYHSALKSVLIEINTHQTTLADVTREMKTWGLVPDARINHVKPHSSERRGGNPINLVFTRPY